MIRQMGSDFLGGRRDLSDELHYKHFWSENLLFCVNVIFVHNYELEVGD